MQENDKPETKLEQTTEITSVDEYARAVLQLLESAQRNVILLTQTLEHRVFNTPEVASQVSRLATSSKNSNMQILLFDPLSLQNKDHRLLNLSRRLDSHIKLLTPAKENRQRQDEFLLIDDRAYLYRSNTETFQASFGLDAPMTTRKLAADFNLLWQRANPPETLRPLHV